MQTYLEDANPILAVKSELYFGFQIRRMRELRNVQMHMAKYRPENYGTITSVLMHMTRHIAHSPVATEGYLKDALRELHFQTAMERFGTFFLHDMDLEHAAMPWIDEKDSDECLLAMSRVKNLQKIKEARGIEVAMVVDEGPTEQFPIGNAPTWEEISLTMARRPTLLMSDWVWDEKWTSRSAASRLFVQFTIDYFLTLSADALKESEFPKPRDLKGAMELWTVRSLSNVLKHVSFKPSNHGLKGHVSGRRNASFTDMMTLFFPIPELNIRKDSVWHPFLIKGYIHEFHEKHYTMSEKEKSSLLLGLKRIFGRLQCLPNAVACSRKACGRLWEQFDGGVRMLTNPIFYKIERVGKAKRRGTARGKQVKASKAIIEARLDEEHRNIPFNEARLKTRQVKKARKRETKRRSGKKNNYRRPPVKKQKKVATSSEESSDDDVVKSSDENFKKQKKVSTSSEESSDNDGVKSSDENSQDLPSGRLFLRRRRVISEDDNEEDEEEEEENEEQEQGDEEEDEDEEEDDEMEDDYEMEEVEDELDELDDSGMDVDEDENM
jgi:hypothetical protein